MANSVGYHEPLEKLSRETVEMHRALASLQEELEAADWYRQRADACENDALREIVLHNMREEFEHAAMLIEWLRRHNPDFEEQIKLYLFTDAPITEVEEIAESGDEGDDNESNEFTIGKP
jgi:ferritin-like protein